MYYEAVNIEGVVGIAIATRPDCLDEEVLDLLEDLNRQTYLWIELGIQTIHEKLLIALGGAIPLSVYNEGIENLKSEVLK